jgi:hypothetical protein
MYGLCVFLDSGFAACAASRNDDLGVFRQTAETTRLSHAKNRIDFAFDAVRDWDVRDV